MLALTLVTLLIALLILMPRIMLTLLWQLLVLVGGIVRLCILGLLASSVGLLMPLALLALGALLLGSGALS